VNTRTAARRRTHTAASRRVREELSATRHRLAATGSWHLVRWLALPGLFVSGLATDAVAYPSHAVPALVVVAALLARYRWPATALLVVAMIATAPAAIVALPFLAYGAARRTASTRRALATFVVAATAGAVHALVLLGGPWNQPVNLALAGGFVVPAILLPAAFGVILGERARRVEALRERNATLERAQRLGDLRARMQERARIAGEMHDVLGHRLSLIALYAGALEVRTRDQPALNSQADLIRRTAGTALDELREVLGILRVDTGRVDDEAPADDVGKRADVASLVEGSRAAGRPVEFVWEGDDLADVDVRVRRAVHRVVRESLTNVLKHAPQASTRVSVRIDGASAFVEVRNGLGAPRTPALGTGLGLVGLRERARLVGGTVTTRRESDEFVLTASLPLAGPGKAPAGGSDGADPHIDHDFLIGGQTLGRGSVADAGRINEATSTRSLDPMSKPAKIILTIIAGAVVLFCGGGLIGAYILADKAKHAAITPAQFAAVQPGQTREQVKKIIGDVGSIGKTAVDKAQEPPVPAGTTCDYAVSRANTDSGPTHVYRFCYKADKLAEKKEMIFQQNSETP